MSEVALPVSLPRSARRDGHAGIERRGLAELRGPLAFVEGVAGVAFHELVDIIGSDGETRPGRVLSTTERGAVVEVFGVTDGLRLDTSRIRFHGRPMEFGVGAELLGRVFDGLGRPRDAFPPPACSERRPIGGSPINPCRRAYPRDFLQTGVSAIDALNSIVLGQKVPIFTESGLAHDELVMQIIRQARAPGVEKFAVVFVALGLPRDVAARYLEGSAVERLPRTAHRVPQPRGRSDGRTAHHAAPRPDRCRVPGVRCGLSRPRRAPRHHQLR